MDGIFSRAGVQGHLCRSLSSFVIIFSGKQKSLVAYAETYSLAVQGDQVFAAQREVSKHSYHIVEYDFDDHKGRMLKKSSNTIAAVDGSSYVTLSVRNDVITCCDVTDDTVKVYSLSGELRHTFAVASANDGDVGALKGALICDDDDDGSVLIANSGNNQLLVMNDRGAFRALQLQPPVERPRGAVYVNGHLYVTSEKDKTISKYSC